MDGKDTKLIKASEVDFDEMLEAHYDVKVSLVYAWARKVHQKQVNNE